MTAQPQAQAMVSREPTPMTQRITEKAVEEAARAIRNYCAEYEVRSRGDYTPDPMCHSAEMATAALTAALPHLQCGTGAETVNREAQKIIDGLRRESERPFSGFAYGPIEATEKLRDALLAALSPPSPPADAPRTSDFEGQALWDLVVDIEGAIGSHAAGATPLGCAVTTLCEDKILTDPWVQKTKFNRDPQTSQDHGEP